MRRNMHRRRHFGVVITASLIIIWIDEVVRDITSGMVAGSPDVTRAVYLDLRTALGVCLLRVQGEGHG